MKTIQAYKITCVKHLWTEENMQKHFNNNNDDDDDDGDKNIKGHEVF